MIKYTGVDYFIIAMRKICPCSIGVILGIFLGLVSLNAYANPVGGQVAAGNATITSPNINTVQINQSTNKAIINWQSFNIKSNEQTHFQQPSSSSITLNRVDPTNGGSSIFGKLTSNGQVWLINPAGIYFGPNAYVNVGGLVATTADIRNEDFMSGHYHFTQSPDWHGAVINEGTIIAHKGAIALFAPNVKNTGLVEANLGTVVLASGSEYTLDFYGDQLVQYRVDKEIIDSAVAPNGQPLKARISNTGHIVANGGTVIMTVKVAKGILDNVINNTGIVEANSVAQKNGEIILMAGNNGNVEVSGKLTASGKNLGETSGQIKVLGKQVKITNNASVDVSGSNGGGEILIGGNAHGAGPEINADSTYIGSGVSIKADALSNGNGGKVIIWSNDNTQFHGNISAQGGLLGGNGGFVETSGKNFLDISGSTVNASAPNGLAGTWLLDPRNVVIDLLATTCSTLPCFSTGDPIIYTPDTDTSHVSVADILTALQGGTSVAITTGTTGTQPGTITVNTPIIKLLGTTPVTLTLDSSNGGGTITIKDPILSISGPLGIILNSGNAISIKADLTTNNGDFLSTSQNATTFAANTTIATGTGSVIVNANADGADGQDLVMNASSAINTSNSLVTINVNATAGGTGLATLGNISTSGGTLTVATDTGGNTTGSNIAQAGSSTLSVGSANFSSSNGTITLDNNNDFTGPVALATGGKNIVINDINDLQLDSIVMGTGAPIAPGTGKLTVTINGAITQSGSTIINSGTGLSSFDAGAGAITLTNDNIFNGDVALTNTGANDVALNNIGNLSLDNISVGGNLSLTANNGSISQASGSKTIVAAGTSSFTATGAIDTITLANNNNQFTGAVSLSNSGANDVSVNNSIPFIISSANVGNNLTLTTSGASTSPITLGATTIGNNLTVTASGTGSYIDQTGALTVPGTASFSAGANAISLTQSGNNFSGAVSLANSGANDVSLVNNAPLLIGTSTIGQNLNLTAAGSISENGAITASSGTNTFSVSAPDADIALDSQTNNFGTNAIVFGGMQSNIRDLGIQNSNTGAVAPDFSGLTNLHNLTLNFSGTGITLPALTLHSGGNLSVTAKGVTGGAINQSGSLIIPGTSSFTSTTGTSALRTITLTDSGNQLTGAVMLTNTGSGNASILNSLPLLLDNVSLGSGALTLNGAGITQSAGTTIAESGTVTLTGNTGVIDLTNLGNQFSGTVSATNSATNDVKLANASTLNLGNFALVGASNLTATATGITQVTGTAMNSPSGNITLNAGTGTLKTNNNDQIFTIGIITLIADHMTLSTNTNSQIGGTSLGGSSSNVILKESTPGLSIGVAGGSGTLNVGQSELNNIFATNVRIGDSNAGAIAINTGAVWVPHANFAKNGVLTFDSGSTISQGGGIDLSTNGASLLFRDATNVDFSNTNNNIDNIAADIFGALSVTNTATKPLTAASLTDDLPTVNGITTAGAVNLTTSGVGGLLTINKDISSGNNDITLNSVGITQADNTNVNAGTGAIAINAGGSAMQFNTGSLTTTNTGTSALTIQNGTTVALGNINAASGTVVLGAGDISSAITQNASTAIFANSLAANTSGSINLNQTNNNIAQLGTVTRGGAFTLANSGPLTISGSLSTGTVTNPVLITTSGLLSLNPGITITGNTTGDAIVLAGQSFINNAGSSVFTTDTGRFLVWSQNNPINDDRGGLLYNFKQYNATYGVTSVLGSGNGFLYTLAPTVTVSLTGTSSKVYDGSLTAPLSAGNYLASIGIDGDTITLIPPLPTTGNYATPNVGTGIAVTATGLSNANIMATNGPATVYGYQLSSPNASGDIGTITQRSITLMPNAILNRTYGDANPTSTTSFSVGGSGLASTDAISTLGVTSPASITSNIGNYDLMGSSVGTTFSTGQLSNYAVTYGTLINGLNITPAILAITANNQVKAYGQILIFSGTEFTAAGLKNNQMVGNVMLTSLGAKAQASVAGSPYTITSSDATGGTFTPTNYTINYINGNLVVLSVYIPYPIVFPYNTNNHHTPLTQSLVGTKATAIDKIMQNLKFKPVAHGNCESISPDIILCMNVS